MKLTHVGLQERKNVDLDRDELAVRIPGPTNLLKLLKTSTYPGFPEINIYSRWYKVALKVPIFVRWRYNLPPYLHVILQDVSQHMRGISGHAPP